VGRRAGDRARSRRRLGVLSGHGPAEAAASLGDVSPELTTDQKGATAEMAIALAAVRLGLGVFKPISDGERYDLILDLRPELLRVQCKWAARRDDVLVVYCQSSRRCANGFLRRTYTARDVDAVAAYCLDLDRCYLLPPSLFAERPSISLRVAPTKNNQRRLVNWAEDYEFAATLRRYQPGAIAQLGERLHGMQEVGGSSPPGSTRL
jgi:PD-(D/E)XK endonuclease